MLFDRREPIGLSITDNAIHMLAVHSSKKGAVALVGFSESKLEPGIVVHGKIRDVDRLTAVIVETYAAAKPQAFTTRDIVFTLPEEVTYYHLFRFPGSLNDQEIASSIGIEAGEIFPIALSELTTDYTIVSRTEEETTVLFAAVPTEIQDSYLHVMQQANLRSKGIGLESKGFACALSNTKREGKATIIVDHELPSANLIIVQDGTPRASYSQLYGSVQEITKTATKKKAEQAKEVIKPAMQVAKKATSTKPTITKNTTPVETANDSTTQPSVLPQKPKKITKGMIDSLATDIKRIATWYERKSGAVVDQCVLTGAGSSLTTLQKELAKRLKPWRKELSITVGNPWTYFPKNTLVDSVRKRGPHFAEAIGAIMQFVVEKTPTINFMGSKNIVVSTTTTAATPTKQFSIKQKKESKKLAKDTKKQLTHRFSWKSFVSRVKTLFFNKRNLGVIVISILFVVALVIIVRYFTRSRTPQSMQETNTTNELTQRQITTLVTIDTGENNPDAIRGRIIRLNNIKESIVIIPENSEEREGTATGVVTLVNKSSTDQPLVATTRLLSEGGVLFRLLSAEFVPANKSIEAKVYADIDGPSGDIEPTTFTIPGLANRRQLEVFATSSEQMSGGLSQVGVLSQGDIDDAAEELESIVTNKAQKLLMKLLEDDEELTADLIRISQTEVTSSTDPGEEVSEVEIISQFTLEALSYKNNDLFDALISSMASKQDLSIEEIKTSGDILIEELSTTSIAEDLTRAEIRVTANIE